MSPRKKRAPKEDDPKDEKPKVPAPRDEVVGKGEKANKAKKAKEEAKEVEEVEEVEATRADADADAQGETADDADGSDETDGADAEGEDEADSDGDDEADVDSDDASEQDADGDESLGGAPDRKPTERLHKFLASTGAGSRRECETFIATGRVTVNGTVVTKMGVKVDPVRDHVRLDGEPVKPEERVYYLLHKPSGYICTNSDERGRPRAIDLIQDRRHRIYTVGRLDAESTGLILCTNDGAISNVLCHPRYRIEKVYQVAVRGDEVSREEIAKIEAGVWLAEGRSSPAKVKPVGRNPRRNETILEMTIFEGRNREIRRVFAKIGLMVRRLTRVRIGPLEIGNLPAGGWQPLTERDLQFVHDAERLYLANREAWDAELPPERTPKRGPMHRPRPTGGRRPRPEGGPRAPHGGARRFGDRPPPRGGARRFGDRPQGDRPPPRGDRPFGDRPRGGDRPFGDRPYPPRRPDGGRGPGNDGGRGPWRPSGGYRGPRGPGGPNPPGQGPGGRSDRPGGGRPYGGGGGGGGGGGWRGPRPDRP